MFEYMMIAQKNRSEALEELNKLGIQGWELCGIDYGSMILKREVKDDQYKESLLKSINKFHKEYMHGCPISQSTLPGFLDPRNELVLATVKYAILVLDWNPDEESEKG